jgi:hypothetical protein
MESMSMGLFEVEVFEVVEEAIGVSCNVWGGWGCEGLFFGTDADANAGARGE